MENISKIIIDSLESLIFVVDKDSTIIHMNKPARLNTKMQISDNLSKNISEINLDTEVDSNQKNKVQHYILKEENTYIGKKLKDIKIDSDLEHEIWIFQDVKGKNISEILDEDKERFKALFAKSIEINYQMIETNEQLKKAQSRMIQQEKLASIGQLAAGVAHELNNPIGFVSSNFSSLRSYIKILLDYISKMQSLTNSISSDSDNPLNSIVNSIKDFEQKQKISFIIEDLDDLFSESEEGVDRITSIVQNLRNFSRVDFGEEMQSYNLNDGIKNTITVAKNELKYSSIIHLELGEIPSIECLGGEINQVLLNILMNASQAIKSQNRREKGNISIKTHQGDGNVICSIKDDGPGIPLKYQNKIFDPFFTTKEAGKGTGLGMNISYDIIHNKHNGELLLESEPNKGTTFTIILPISQKTEEII